MKPVLVDSGFLVAVYKRRDAYHSLCMSVYEDLNRPLVSCEAVVTEALHLLRNTPGAGIALLSSIEQGLLALPLSLSRSAGKVRNVLEKYQDVPADCADACLVVLAGELDCGDILTVDSDFLRYRWLRDRRFNLLIPLD